jgi:hypothetical protein
LFGHNDHRYVWRKKGGLQAKEHHPNREAQGWQHHVVGVIFGLNIRKCEKLSLNVFD